MWLCRGRKFSLSAWVREFATLVPQGWGTLGGCKTGVKLGFDTGGDYDPPVSVIGH